MSARHKFKRRQVEKPPYRVPLMEEINALEPNGFKVVSTFAGGGGSSLGYRMAGFQVVWINEFIEAARATYAANARPYTVIDGRDIRTVQPEDILAAISLKTGELDVFDGSPPCASFSTAGKREKGWGKVKAYSDGAQRSDDLFFEYARLVEGLQPKVFVAENVSGLVKGTAKGYFKLIHKRLTDAGYIVRASVLNAMWLGVPQARERTIFIGVRRDLGLQPVFPKPLPFAYSVRDALPWIHACGGIRDSGFSRSKMIPADRPCPTIMAGGGNGMNTSQFGVEAERCIAVGSAPGFGSEGWQSPDLPAKTIGAHPNSGNGRSSSDELLVERPDKPGTQKRKFSIAELKRICSFPDDFVVKGTYAQQWERLGRAVPPVMMSHIAATVRDEILRRA